MTFGTKTTKVHRRWTLIGLGKNRNKKDIKTEKEL